MKSSVSVKKNIFNPITVTLTIESREELQAFLALAQSFDNKDALSRIEESSTRVTTVEDISKFIEGMISNRDFDNLSDI